MNGTLKTASAAALLGVLLLAGGCGLLRGTKLAPVAVIEALPRRGEAPLEVRFSAAPSYTFYGKLKSFSWDFGDGAVGDQLVETHTYAAPGTYIVSLRVQNSLGIVNSDRVTIFVENPPPPPPSPPPEPPAERTDVQENELVKITRTLPQQLDADGEAQIEVTVEAKVALELVALVESLEGLEKVEGELTTFRQGMQAGETLKLSYRVRDADGGGGTLRGTVRAKPPDAASQTLELSSTLEPSS